MATIINGIYKAHDCTDLQDVTTAIEDVTKLIKLAESNSLPTKALYRRLLSLEKRREIFIKYQS